MKSLPLPAIVAALAAVATLPFNVPAAGTLLITAGLGSIIHADYVQRHCRVRLPRLAAPPARQNSRSPLPREPHRLAA
jgi:hypothetical protein